MICYGAHLYINVHYSWEQKNNNNILFSWFIKIIRLPFFFSFFILSCLSLSLSFTLISQAHSLNSSLTLSTSITDPRSLPSIGVPDWETHGARRWSECLLMDIGSFTLPMVFFFFFLLCTGGGGVDGVCGCDCVCIWW